MADLDDHLPPLPPPLPPTHARSFSSSSSSDAGSPRPPSLKLGGWGSSDGGGQGAMKRSDSQSSSGGGFGTVRRSPTFSRAGKGSAPGKSPSNGQGSPSPVLTRAPGMARTQSTNSVSSTSSSRSTGSHTRSRAMSRSNSGSASSRPSPYPSTSSPRTSPHPSTSSSATQRTRPSTLLSRVSPSLASPSHFTVSHSNLSSVGLSSFTPPLASPNGLRGFAKGLSGLPSPPHTASEASGSSRYGTTRSSGTDPASTAGSSGGDSTSPTKPARPPKSQARRGSLGLQTTPPRSRGVPAIGRTSPTVMGSPASTRQELDSVTTGADPVRRSVRDVFETEAREADSSGDYSVATSVTPTRGAQGVEELEPTRRLRARTVSGDEEGDEDDERRRERRNRNAAAVRQKNQRILDSINGQLSPSSSSGSFDNPTSSSNPTSTLRRSSTSSTIREIADGSSPASSSLLSSNGGGGPWLEENRDARRLLTEPDEFGGMSDGVRRSSTLGDISGNGGRSERDSPLRSRTQGFRYSGRASLGGSEDVIPLRSSTSMSFHPTSPEQRQRSTRRSDLVGSERTRSASAFGGTEERDADFVASMRRLASPRVRTQSEVSRTTFEGEGEEELPDSPAASMRNRPALPREFRTSPSAANTPSRFATRPSLDVDRDSNLSPSSQIRTLSPRFSSSTSSTSALSPRDRLASPPVSSPRSAVGLSTPDAAERRRYSRSTGLDEERGGPSRSAQEASSSGSGEGSRHAEAESRRTQSISEIIERPYSRQSRNDYRSPGAGSNGTLTPPPTSSRYGDIAMELQARKERLRSVEVGSDAWIAEFEDIRRRARSRQSGSSGDARSANGAISLSERDRDRTVRAINDLLAGQGIVASAIDPASPASSKLSPRKDAGFDTSSSRPRRISFANGTHDDSPAAPGSALLARSNSNGSRSGAESSLGRYGVQDGQASDHHKLLLSAFDRFSATLNTDQDLPESADLVKRMQALIASTTKLNLGLRGLVEAVRNEQVQSQLDEEDRSAAISVSQFEKSVNALLRSSDDQVRNLSEDLIAFTRVERERDRLRRDSDFGSVSRPVSRAQSGYDGNGLPLTSPARRSHTASPSVPHSASVSLVSARSPILPREVLRNPLANIDESASRRHTLSGSGRSAVVGSVSPSPAAGRRESAFVRSPLSTQDASFDTPSRRSSSVVPGAIGLGLTSRTSTTTPRRIKTSDSTVRAGSPSFPTHIHTSSHASNSNSIRFPTSSTSSPHALTRVDSTPAVPGSSPTRPSRRRSPSASTSGSYTDADRRALEAALEMGANDDEQDMRAGQQQRFERPESPVFSTTARGSLERSRSASPEVELAAGGGGGGGGGKTRGSIGAKLKNALRSRKGTNEALPPSSSQYDVESSPRSSIESMSAGGGSPAEEMRRVEKRREVEEILRRAQGRN